MNGERKKSARQGGAGALRIACGAALGLALGLVNCQVDDREVGVTLPAFLTPDACSSNVASTRCSGTYVQRCGADSRWQDDPLPCALGCADGRCLECEPSTFRVRCEQGLVARCDGGRIARAPCQQPQFCEDGACVASCAEGQVQCDGESGRSVCVGGTAYVPADACTGEGGICFGGRCVGCRPGDVQCGAGALSLSTCSTEGSWLPAQPCPLDAPVCVSSLGRCSVCEPGKARCGAASVERCDDAGSTWLVAAPCSGATPVCVPETGACGACSEGDVRFCADALGNCAAGQQRCGADSLWGPCSIQPASVDICIPGQDADCNGTPNDPPGGCSCTGNVSCGTTDVGACQLGISSCTAGMLGACVGAVGPAPRNCRSSDDNDCDGRADNVLDTICQCVPDSVEACDAHGSSDGIGICQAGRRTCVASAGALSSSWGPCVGSVGPSALNCASGLDNDCNGVPDRADLSCAPPAVVVTLESRGNATFGVVHSSPPGLECSRPPCSASFPAGTQVTLTSGTVAQFLHGFSGWGGPCSGLDDCPFVASANVTVTAAFDRANVAFVTSSVTNGNLGGREGGDAICNQLAAAANLDGQYLAWLSTSTGAAVDRLRGSRGWIRADGLPFVDTLDDLPDGMFYPLRIDQLRRDVGEVSVLTASGGDGRLGPPFSAPCGDFTDQTSSTVVDGGRTSAVGLLWSTFTQAGCTVQRPIYCFGVGREVALRPEPDAGRTAFISTAFVPAGGRAGVDQICQTDANRLGLSGTFKAVLTTSTASAASPFDLTGPPWIGLDGTRIASTAQAFFAATQWDTVPKAEFPYGNSGIWVGGTSLTAPGTAANTCNDWTSTAGNVDAGASGLTTVQQFFYGYGQNPCSSSMSVVCLQQ